MLGQDADPEQDVALSAEMMGADAALSSLYESGDDNRAGLGASAPKLNRWLGDVRKFFPAPVVQVMFQDAMERHNLRQLLLEPEVLEQLEPDVHLAATLIELNKLMPARSRETARIVVKKVVQDLEKKLSNPMRQAVEGTLSRATRNRRPKFNEIDWHKTIRLNLRHYQSDYQTIIPERLEGYGKRGQALRHIILCVDQSGSMAASVVYAGIFGAILASLKSVKTSIVFFDTAITDMTQQLSDPVDLLFSAQLGGGTDINKALQYVEKLTTNPAETILVLITDLYEGGNTKPLLKTAARIQSSGTQIVTLLALSDEGRPSYDHETAAKFAALGIPSFACTPEQFPNLMAAAIKKEDLKAWVGRNTPKS